MQLRQPEPFGMFDHHDAGICDIDADASRQDAEATELSRMPVCARIPAGHRMPVAARDTTRCTDTCRRAAREDYEDTNIAQDLGVEGLVHLTPRACGCSSMNGLSKRKKGADEEGDWLQRLAPKLAIVLGWVHI